MPISDNAFKTQCAAFFGDTLDLERRAFILVALKGLERGHASLLERLSPEATPEGHASFLRSLAREK